MSDRSPPTGLLYLTESDVRQTLTMAEAIEWARRGIEADAAGRVHGDKFYLPIGEAGGFIKPFAGHLEGESLAFVKTFNFFPSSPQQTTTSLVVLFDAHSGRQVCIMEADWITGLKTGASTAVTAQTLAPPNAARLAIFGAGMQGRMHLRGLAQLLPLSQVWIFDPLEGVAEAYAERMSAELGVRVQAAPLEARAEIVPQTQVVVMVTTADEPLIKREWLGPGTFVAKLGSYQELALDVVTGADKVIVDRWSYLETRVPELKQLAEQGAFSRRDVHAEWPEVVAGRRAGRESAAEVILYLALGLWGEYAALLPAVYRRALDKGLGRWLPASGAAVERAPAEDEMR